MGPGVRGEHEARQCLASLCLFLCQKRVPCLPRKARANLSPDTHCWWKRKMQILPVPPQKPERTCGGRGCHQECKFPCFLNHSLWLLGVQDRISFISPSANCPHMLLCVHVWGVVGGGHCSGTAVGHECHQSLPPWDVAVTPGLEDVGNSMGHTSFLMESSG